MLGIELDIWELKVNRASALRAFGIWWKSQVMVAQCEKC